MQLVKEMTKEEGSKHKEVLTRAMEAIMDARCVDFLVMGRIVDGMGGSRATIHTSGSERDIIESLMELAAINPNIEKMLRESIENLDKEREMIIDSYPKGLQK